MQVNMVFFEWNKEWRGSMPFNKVVVERLPAASGAAQRMLLHDCMSTFFRKRVSWTAHVFHACGAANRGATHAR